MSNQSLQKIIKNIDNPNVENGSKNHLCRLEIHMIFPVQISCLGVINMPISYIVKMHKIVYRPDTSLVVLSSRYG